MSSNVGLSTPRGSGTSGYVQRNISYLKPRDTGAGAPYPPTSSGGSSGGGFKQRKPDKQILEHDRRRDIEVKCLEEQDRLEEENERMEKEGGKGGEKVLSDEEIEERVEELRKRLVREFEEERDGGRRDSARRGGARDEKGREKERGKRQFKTYQVHELAEAKIEESERFKRALGIREDGEEEGSRGRYDGRGKERET